MEATWMRTGTLQGSHPWTSKTVAPQEVTWTSASFHPPPWSLNARSSACSPSSLEATVTASRGAASARASVRIPRPWKGWVTPLPAQSSQLVPPRARPSPPLDSKTQRCSPRRPPPRRPRTWRAPRACSHRQRQPLECPRPPRSSRCRSRRRCPSNPSLQSPPGRPLRWGGTTSIHTSESRGRSVGAACVNGTKMGTLTGCRTFPSGGVRVDRLSP
mmetsp:Transcript_14341/g.42326  ORF Transcript_14341/g.42326 Transcript_14341/m.42326 type:complete len:216 (+) Transcript_14341:1058-1705(+)